MFPWGSKLQLEETKSVNITMVLKSVWGEAVQNRIWGLSLTALNEAYELCLIGRGGESWGTGEA